MDLDSINRQYDEDGCVIARGLFSADQVAEIDAQIVEFSRTIGPTLKPGQIAYEDGPRRTIKSIVFMENFSPYFAELRADDRLLIIVSKLLGEGETELGVVALFAKTARDGSVTPAHQDNAYYFWEPPLMLRASLAIDTHTPENGAMVCLKGSHRHGIFPHTPTEVKGFSQSLAGPADEQRFAPIQMCMGVGDVLFHHGDVIHYSGANKTERSRRILSFTYNSSVARQNEKKLQLYRQHYEEMYGEKTR